jgi:nitrogen fixation/metabolism regulation signal transduction histidine kinase
MTAELRRRRADLVAANAELETTNRQLDEQRRRFGSILERLDAGVLAFWEDGRLAFLNDTARRLLGRDGAAADVERLDELLAPAALAPLRAFLVRAREGGAREETLKVGRRVLEAHLAQAQAEAGSGGPSIVTLEDTTDLVAAERAAAWEEAARRMAHEIKNPLTPIRLAAERMRRRAADGGDGLPKVVEEGASTIVQEVTALAALVDTFQRFARLPAAVLEPTDLGAVVRQVAKLYDGVKRGISVTADAVPDLPPARADSGQLRRALINLVDNAVSATPEGGRVRIAARVADGHAVLAVEDDGPGIPAADRERVFEPDFSTKGRGSGLGLAIVARIAAEHGGRVRVEENAPHGCRFLLEWPAS